MKTYVRFLAVWALNSLLVFGAASYFPLSFVLGNAFVSPVYAGILTGLLFTLFCRVSKPILKRMLIKSQGRLMMFAFYWLINSLGIWLIARASFFSGFGIVSFYWAFALGFVASGLQWGLRQLFKALKLLEK